MRYLTLAALLLSVAAHARSRVEDDPKPAMQSGTPLTTDQIVGGTYANATPGSVIKVNCELSNGSCTRHGYMLFRGAEYLPKNQPEAAVYFAKGCEWGEAKGCTALGYAQKDGAGLIVDLPAARVSFEKGCKGGDSRGCAGLGFMLQSGSGGSVEKVMARVYFEKACDLGDAQMCKKLGS